MLLISCFSFSVSSDFLFTPFSQRIQHHQSKPSKWIQVSHPIAFLFSALLPLLFFPLVNLTSSDMLDQHLELRL